jgi:hypothetical protein
MWVCMATDAERAECERLHAAYSDRNLDAIAAMIPDEPTKKGDPPPPPEDLEGEESERDGEEEEMEKEKS